ncbi:transporter, partial [Aspergillus sclerotialis]
MSSDNSIFSEPQQPAEEVSGKTPAVTSNDQQDLQEPSTDEDIESGKTINIERIYRKLDLRIIPAFWVLYFLCSAIRSNVGLAQTMNSDKGHDLGSVLNLSSHQISTGLALFYVCYVVFEIPSNLVMTKLSPHVWMSRIVISVGVIGACMAAMKAAWSLYLLRLLLGIVEAGLWPGMTYYLTLFYPPTRIGKRIGQYYTAAQVSAAVVGLVSAGFQEMDGAKGLVGFQWMFLVYGVITVVNGIVLLWWLPDRPNPPGEAAPQRGKFTRWIPESAPALVGRDAEIHYTDLKRVYHPTAWRVRDLARVFLDWRLWPLLVMYFGVVGVGIGVQNYSTVIIKATDPGLSGVQLNQTTDIQQMDLIVILLITPLSDRFHHHRAIFFSIPTLLQILGLLLTTYSGTASNPWPRYGGLLIVGFGLGPTVPVTMTWTTEIFQPRHGEVGVAAASAVVSGLGNLGSVVTTYALYTGWKSDAEAEGRDKFKKSNLVMVGILAGSIAAAALMEVLVRVVDGKED